MLSIFPVTEAKNATPTIMVNFAKITPNVPDGCFFIIISPFYMACLHVVLQYRICRHDNWQNGAKKAWPLGYLSTARLKPKKTSKFTLCRKIPISETRGIDRLYPCVLKSRCLFVARVVCRNRADCFPGHFNYRPEKGSLQSNLLCVAPLCGGRQGECRSPLPLCPPLHVLPCAGGDAARSKKLQPHDFPLMSLAVWLAPQ